jgi:hypothetical protein
MTRILMENKSQEGKASENGVVGRGWRISIDYFKICFKGTED